MTSESRAHVDRPSLICRFDANGLYELRSSVAAHAAELGLLRPQLSRLLVVATELATNAVRHGGGGGELRLWAADGMLVCQVVDEGPGIADPQSAGTKREPITGDGGRGLWLVRHFSDRLDISLNSPGTAFTVSFHL